MQRAYAMDFYTHTHREREGNSFNIKCCTQVHKSVEKTTLLPLGMGIERRHLQFSHHSKCCTHGQLWTEGQGLKPPLMSICGGLQPKKVHLNSQSVTSGSGDHQKGDKTASPPQKKLFLPESNLYTQFKQVAHLESKQLHLKATSLHVCILQPTAACNWDSIYFSFMFFVSFFT